MKHLAPVLLFAAALVSCSNKTNPRGNTAIFTTELKVQSNDVVRISNELDAAFNDVDSILENKANVCGGSFTINTADTPNTMTLTYSGNTCDALRSRSGSIVISYVPGTDFATAGDSVNVTFNSLVITRRADGKTLGFNGSFAYRNISGSKLSGLASGSTIVHTLWGSGITVTYDDATISTWRFTRQRSYTNNQGILVSTVGTDSANSVGNVADWGANRYGNSVLLVPTTPLVVSQSCGWRLTGGQETLTNPSGSTTLSFGLDSTGKTASCPLAGNPFYYQLVWTGTDENPFTAVLPY